MDKVFGHFLQPVASLVLRSLTIRYEVL